MNARYLIGVDLGTSAVKAALYRPDGTLLAGPWRGFWLAPDRFLKSVLCT
jgi:molecular chaperone DnaK (HSP70)